MKNHTYSLGYQEELAWHHGTENKKQYGPEQQFAIEEARIICPVDCQMVLFPCQSTGRWGRVNDQESISIQSNLFSLFAFFCHYIYHDDDSIMVIVCASSITRI